MPECILKADGRIFIRSVEITTPDEREINLDAAMLAVLGRGINLKARNIAQLPLGPVGACVLGDASVYLTMRLPQLKLKTAVAIDGEKVQPVFGSGGTAIDLTWQPPKDCSLIYSARMEPSGTGWACKLPYLYALDIANGKDFYHLPLPNLYSDCRICTGLETPTAGANLIDCFAASLNHFEASRWNGHLIRDNGDEENAKQVFQFKAVKDQFETVPVKDWRKYSKKVGTTLLEYIVL